MNAFFDAKNDLKPLGEEVNHLEKLHKKISENGFPEDQEDSWIVLTAMAASVEKCYSNIEKILKNLLQELDGSIPSSQDWHRQLIERAASPGPHGRPSLLTEDQTKVLHDLRSFRHRERNAYIPHLDPDIVLEKASITINAVDSFGAMIHQQDNGEKFERQKG
jgi:hypothetical protein